MSTNRAANAYGKAGAQRGGGGYSNIPEPGSPTYTEAWALIEAARRMAVAIQSSDLTEMNSRKPVREAVRLNWRLWTIFQAELTTNGDGVDPEIRVNMLTLCRFVDNHTIETLKELSAEKIAILIDLNRNIAQGLLESLEGQHDESKKAISEETQKVTEGDASGSVNESA